MIKKTIKYVNLGGEQAELTAYFNLSKVEATRLAAKYGVQGDLAAGLTATVEHGEFDKMLAIIEDFILTSYGEKAADLSGFIKTPENKATFSNSIPYAELFEELLTDPDKLKAFIESITPKQQAEAPVVPIK